MNFHEFCGFKTGRCRFCGAVGDSGLLAMGNVCADTECQEFAANACSKAKSCGHPCGGVVNETKCLPCLEVVCHKRENELSESLKDPKLTQDAGMFTFHTLILKEIPLRN